MKRTGEITNKAILERYGQSQRMRYIQERPLVPVGYIQTKPPKWKKVSINAYTSEGRAGIHKSLGINQAILHRLMKAKEYGRSIEYMDNRLSLYCAQYGKCAVTGKLLDYDEIHCHHRTPRKAGGNDRYGNLLIVHAAVPLLIHAVCKATIEKHLKKLNKT